MGNEVIRLNKDTINRLEDFRKTLIEYYTEYEKDTPELLKYDLDKWQNASFNELIDRAIFTAKWYLNN